MNRYISLCSALLLCLAGCTADLNDQQTNWENSNISKKILNSSNNSIKGSIIIRFAPTAEKRLATRAIMGGATRSGVADVDVLLDDIGGYSVEPLFMITDANRDKVMDMGLHMWYVLRFEDDANLDEVATRLATIADVERIQFNEKIQKLYKPERLRTKGEHTIRSTMYSRSSYVTDIPFEDGYKHYLWNLDNQGELSHPDGYKSVKWVVEADVNAVPAWKLCKGDPSIVVAVCDEGVMYSHEDLMDNICINKKEANGQKGVDDDNNGYIDDIYGYNFADGNATISWAKEGDSGHGTHVAGIVAATNNNRVGISSIAGGSGKGDGVNVFSVQIFSGEEVADLQGTARAIQYAADRGAHILQCSWGVPGGAYKNDNAYKKDNRAECDAIDYFKKNGGTEDGPISGGLAIFAAGNELSSVPGYPSAYVSCISVSSIAPMLRPAYYTNYGKGVDIGAPGGDQIYDDFAGILSTVPKEWSQLKGEEGEYIPYDFFMGTSMACPMVSGVAALGLSYAKQLGKRYTPGQFTSMLLSATNNFDPFFTGSISLSDGSNYYNLNFANYKGQMGSGYVDAHKLLLEIDGTPFATVSTGVDATVDLAPFFGGGVERLALSTIEISDADKETIGLTSCTYQSGKLKISCSKSGYATITVKLLVGGNNASETSAPKPTTVSKTFVLMAKQGVAGNNGWL